MSCASKPPHGAWIFQTCSEIEASLRHLTGKRDQGRECPRVYLAGSCCSRQFGRASAPIMPHPVQTMRGPKAGTGTVSG